MADNFAAFEGAGAADEPQGFAAFDTIKNDTIGQQSNDAQSNVNTAASIGGVGGGASQQGADSASPSDEWGDFGGAAFPGQPGQQPPAAGEGMHNMMGDGDETPGSMMGAAEDPSGASCGGSSSRETMVVVEAVEVSSSVDERARGWWCSRLKQRER